MLMMRVLKSRPSVFRLAGGSRNVLLRFALSALCLFANAFAAGAQQIIADWSFNQPNDMLGWLPNTHLADVCVTNGALSCRAIGSDPILEYRPSLSLPASSHQVVEIRLRANADGTAELFWANSSTGRYGGFCQEKSLRFKVRGDGSWHTYRVLPFWQREGTIVRLRLDVYDGALFEIESVRLLQLKVPGPSDSVVFDFTSDRSGWLWFTPMDKDPTAQWDPARLPNCGSGLLLSPPLTLDCATSTVVSVRLSVDRGRYATLFFATDRAPGMQKHTFPVQPDGRERIYNLDMLGAPAWSGRLIALGLQLSDDLEAVGTLSHLSVGQEPRGPSQIHVLSLAVDAALPRVGRPSSISAILSNRGGETANQLEARLDLPSEIRFCPGAKATQSLPPLSYDDELVVSWNVEAVAPLQAQARLVVTNPGAESVQAVANLRFTVPPPATKSDYVPEPNPVRGPYEVGVYYFPGWKTASQWEPLRRFPERKPVLGWYREGDPEIADWHIKWAVEHGITFFAYDWYWTQGARQLEHALHDGFFKARYRHLLKFCLLWANHNPPGSSSLEDCVDVTRFWIENYFRRPEHLLWSNKPVVIIFAPDRLREDLGTEGTRKALEAMRGECRAAGMGGLFIMACVGDAGGARRAAEEGYDSVTCYNWAGLGMTGEGLLGPFDTLVDGYRRQWEHFLEQSPLPLAPVPVSGGWDSRPWHGENHLVRFGRTPGLFRQHLQDAKNLLETARYPTQVPKAILIEAWNEWGEGSYIEPHSEFGFGYLDAVRDVFTPASALHTDRVPSDIGLGPYEVPVAPPRTEWLFSQEEDVEAWSNTMDLADLQGTGEFLRARSTGHDPAFFGPGTHASAARFSAVTLRLRLTPTNPAEAEDSAQLFWRTTRLPESESTSVRFPVKLDGKWHDYRLQVADNPRWRGTITRLRLDPAGKPHLRVDLGRIGLVK